MWWLQSETAWGKNVYGLHVLLLYQWCINFMSGCDELISDTMNEHYLYAILSQNVG